MDNLGFQLVGDAFVGGLDLDPIIEMRTEEWNPAVLSVVDNLVVRAQLNIILDLCKDIVFENLILHKLQRCLKQR